MLNVAHFLPFQLTSAPFIHVSSKYFVEMLIFSKHFAQHWIYSTAWIDSLYFCTISNLKKETNIKNIIIPMNENLSNNAIFIWYNRYHEHLWHDYSYEDVILNLNLDVNGE